MKIEDIAKFAGVSISAVSLALNNKPGVSEETREKILKIVNKYGYTHRSMVTKTEDSNSRIIKFLACINNGIVSDQYQEAPFFATLLKGLEKECKKLGYALILSSVDLNNLRNEIEKLELNHPSGGIILLGTNLNVQEVQIAKEIQPNIVVVDALFESLDVNCVVMNNIMGGQQAAAYLADSGHKQIGYVQSYNRALNLEYRKYGFNKTLKEKGLLIEDDNLFSITASIESAQEEFKEIIKKRKKQLPSAIFCENDYMAIAAIKALQESGIKVPDEVSVIGFDNIARSTIITPELTTINVEKEAMGSLAVQRLVDIIEKKDLLTIKYIIDTKLIERKSCKITN